MRISLHALARLLGCLTLATVTLATSTEIPPHGKAIVLFDGHDLRNFDVFLKDHGLNNDPDHIFSVEKDVLHVSGREFGYVVTKQEFANYYLRAEFKWGEGTYAPRAGQARDSGILYHVQGAQKVWPTSVEFQIIEGGTGDFWMTDGGALTGPNGVRVTGPPGSALKIDRIGKGPWNNVAGYRDPVGELEKPHGQWNLLELVAQGDQVKQFVNRKLANEGSQASPASGKILFQSEGAEVFFRNIKLYPLKK
jgi:3-keto-disaccharide hydrolase